MDADIKYNQKQQSLCDDLIVQAEVTWNRIRMSVPTGIIISEESITDYNLLDLQIKHPDELQTRKIARKREARIGADWEWWLGSDSLWIGLRVQAKRIDLQNFIYRNLNKTNIYGRQIDLLIKNSINNNPPMIPIYVFYNYWNDNVFDPPWLCQTYPKSVQMLGCSISHAIYVKAILDKGSEKVQDVMRAMYPWSCLVCCRGFSKENKVLPYRTVDFLFGAFREYIKDEPDFYERERFVLKRAPDYVYKILEGMKLSKDDWYSIKVNRIIVTQEKDKQNIIKNP